MGFHSKCASGAAESFCEERQKNLSDEIYERLQQWLVV